MSVDVFTDIYFQATFNDNIILLFLSYLITVSQVTDMLYWAAFQLVILSETLS